MNYTFPFDTCEIPYKNGISQPYSVLINLLSCLVIFNYLTKCQSNHSFFLLLSFFIFELFHTFSHSIHIPGKIQIIVIHLLAYIVNLFLLNFFYKRNNFYPNKYFLLILTFLFCLDITGLILNKFFIFFSTQVAIFLLILFYYKNDFEQISINKLKNIAIISLLITFLILNEILNCQKMLKKYPNFPFHVFIEILGVVFLYQFCRIFAKY